MRIRYAILRVGWPRTKRIPTPGRLRCILTLEAGQRRLELPIVGASQMHETKWSTTLASKTAHECQESADHNRPYLLPYPIPAVGKITQTDVAKPYYSRRAGVAVWEVTALAGIGKEIDWRN